MSMPGSIVVGLEQGVVALLGSKSTHMLLKITGTDELILLSTALMVATRAVPASTPLLGRVSATMTQIFFTIALNTILGAVVVPGDPGVSCVNLLGVFFLGASVGQERTSVTAQYLLVSNLSTALQGFGGESLALAWALAFVPHAMGWESSLANLAQLITVETLSAWSMRIIPRSLLLPSTLLLLFLLAPFTEEFPPLQRMYRFAVFAVSNDLQLHAIAPWVLAVVLWALWNFEPDAVSKRFASVAGANMGVLVLLDAMKFAMDNDPAPTLMALLITIQIFEDPTCEKKSARSGVVPAPAPTNTHACSPPRGTPPTP